MGIAFYLSLIAGLSTMLGSAFMFFGKKNKYFALTFTLYFSFVMILFISIFDLATSAYRYLITSSYDYPFIITIIFIIIGIYIGRGIEKIDIGGKNYDKSLYKVGIASFIVLILHNIPEGCVQYVSH